MIHCAQECRFTANEGFIVTDMQEVTHAPAELLKLTVTQSHSIHTTFERVELLIALRQALMRLHKFAVDA